MSGLLSLGRLQLRGLLDGIRVHAISTGADPEHVRFIESLMADLAPPSRAKLTLSDEARDARKAETLVALKVLATELRRTPTKLDIRAAGRERIISPSLIQKDFGSLAEAMRQAGIQPRIPGHSIEDSGFGRDHSALRQPTNYRPLRARGWRHA